MHSKLTLIALVATLLLIFTANRVEAQVTIGSDILPEKGALLELKTKEANNPTSPLDNNNVTSNEGGLVLPRVKLTHIDKLTPFLTDTEANKVAVKITHAGLMVYNINDTFTTATDPNQVFKQGIYVWNGARWSLLVREEFKFFYMPTFNLNISKLGEHTIDLYNEYTTHFAREGSVPTDFPSLINNPSAKKKSVPLFSRNELDYFVTYHDNSIVKDISVDNKGIMTYTVKPTTPINPFCFINIVFVIK